MVNIGKEFRKITGGIKKLPKQISNVPKTINKKLDGALKKATDGLKKETKKGLSEAKKNVNKGFGSITKILKEVISQFKKVFEKFTLIFAIFACIEKIFKSIISYIMCGVRLLLNFPSCFIYYFLDIVYFTLVDLPISIICWIVPPFKDFVSFIKEIFFDIDDIVYKAYNFHLNQYSPQVLSRCYKCKIEAMPNFSSLGKCGEKPKKKKKVIVYKKCDLN